MLWPFVCAIEAIGAVLLVAVLDLTGESVAAFFAAVSLVGRILLESKGPVGLNGIPKSSRSGEKNERRIVRRKKCEIDRLS